MATKPHTSVPFLSPRTFGDGLNYLVGRDPDLARILTEFGPPPMWARKAGFPTLIHIILEQQVSLASARAAFDRLIEHVSPLTPERFLELDDPTLKAIGFSRQKAGYGRELARSVAEGRLNFSALDKLDDAAVKVELTKVKGVGAWTADIYLLMVLRRPDIWPKGDMALATAAQKVKRLDSRPTQEELDAMSHVWKPWRAVAARLLWHFYLSQ